jgi:hypothetical protein
MQWSKLKNNVENFLCDSLKNRVEIYSTWYKKSGSPDRARGTILVDKKIVFEANTDKWIALKKEKSNEELWQLGIFEDLKFRDSLIEYLNLSIDKALISKNVLIRALALVDRRVGKRRLSEIQISEEEHEFVKFMYNLRCRVEKLELGDGSCVLLPNK